MDDLEISPAEAKQHLARGENVLLVDVREPWEFEVCRIAGAKLIPMGTIPANLQALDTDDEVICYCHHGMRSMDVAVWLRAGPRRSIPAFRATSSTTPTFNPCRAKSTQLR
jgi:rhodanese-related sulfurtransferase